MTNTKPWRPRKLTDETIEVYLDALRRGYSKTAACGVIEISPQALWSRLRDDPDFKERVDAACAVGLVWWEDTSKGIAEGSMKGDSRMTIFGLKNRGSHEWRDRIENDHLSSDGSMTPHSVERRLVDKDGSVEYGEEQSGDV